MYRISKKLCRNQGSQRHLAAYPQVELDPDNGEPSADNIISSPEPPPTPRQGTPQTSAQPPLATQPRSHTGHRARPPVSDPGQRGHPKGHPGRAKENGQTPLISVSRQQPHRQEPIDLKMQTPVQPDSTSPRSRRGGTARGPPRKQLLYAIGTILLISAFEPTTATPPSTSLAEETPTSTPPRSPPPELTNRQTWAPPQPPEP